MFILDLFNFFGLSFKLSSNYLHFISIYSSFCLHFIFILSSSKLPADVIVAKSFQGFDFAGIVYAPARDNPEIRLLDGLYVELHPLFGADLIQKNGTVTMLSSI